MEKSTTEKVFDYVKKNRNATLRQIAEGVGLAAHTNALFHLKKLILSGRIAPNKTERWSIIGE